MYIKESQDARGGKRFCGTLPFLSNVSEDDGGGDEDVVGRGTRVVGGGE